MKKYLAHASRPSLRIPQRKNKKSSDAKKKMKVINKNTEYRLLRRNRAFVRAMDAQIHSLSE